MMRWYLLGSLLLVLNACQLSEKDLKVADDPLIIGKATPIQLGQDETFVPLKDYVLDGNRIDSIKVDGPFDVQILNSNLLIRGRAKKPAYNLTFWSGGMGESIMLKQTKLSLYSFVFKGAAKFVKIKGSFNAWNANKSTLDRKGPAFSTYELLSSGRYEYKYVVDGKEMLDPLNKDSISNGAGGYNSVITIAGPKRNKLPILSLDSFDGDKILIKSTNTADKIYAYWGNTLLDENLVENSSEGIVITIPDNAKEVDRSAIRLWAYNKEGISNDVLIPLHKGNVLSSSDQLSRADKEAMIMYFLMVDRFNNGNKNNDRPLRIPEVHPKADFFGGDLAGVTQKINDGYFDWLGVNTIWLSPITQNPEGAFGKYPEPETNFSAYHGYWPISNVKVDSRFGSEQELKELIGKAHAGEMNVLLDYVANHVHELHPIYQEHPDWATNLYLPDGTLNTERWDEHRLTTWFDTFLPTLDLSRMETVDPLTDSAMFWLTQYGIDGFRHDATKHIPEVFWRVLTQKVKKHEIETASDVFQIGETYGSHELIKSYISTGMLDAQFDFNMYDRAVSAFAEENGSLQLLADALIESLRYYGGHNLMGYITGNQDRPRFISYADGSLMFGEDTKHAGWNREISIQDTTAYRKLSALTAFMMSIPGIPCIYYGDEYGSPGGNDPDNRRQMQFEGLDNYQKATRDRTKKLIELRKNNLALIYGETNIEESSDSFLMISRKYFDNEVWAVFNTSKEAVEQEIKEGMTGHFYGSVSGGVLTLPAQSFDILTLN